MKGSAPRITPVIPDDAEAAASITTREQEFAMKINTTLRHAPCLALLGSLLLTGSAQAQSGETECIAPAKPGGGYDLTCRLAANGLEETGRIDQPMVVSYMPGGIGAVAYN